MWSQGLLDLCSYFVCMQVYSHGCVCVFLRGYMCCTGACGCACVGSEDNLAGGLFIRSHLPCFLRQVSHRQGTLQLEEVSCPVSPRESPCLLLPRTRIPNAGHIPCFLRQTWESHAGPPASVASTLLLDRLPLVPPVFAFIVVDIFETGSCYVTLTDLELSI